MRIGITTEHIGNGNKSIPKNSIVVISGTTDRIFTKVTHRGITFEMTENWPMFIKEIKEGEEFNLAKVLWE